MDCSFLENGDELVQVKQNMTRARSIPPESFEEILAWFNSDREVAAQMYVQLHHDLSKLIQWKGLNDGEELTDEVFDRVARKVHEVRPTYVGDPRLYFRGVANNVIKEHLKKLKNQVPLESIEPPSQSAAEADPDKETLEECLDACLDKLNSEKRELILAYYAKEKQAKIDHRNEIAAKLGVTVRALRVKAYRIREKLERCMERCVKAKGQRG